MTKGLVSVSTIDFCVSPDGSEKYGVTSGVELVGSKPNIHYFLTRPVMFDLLPVTGLS